MVKMPIQGFHLTVTIWQIPKKIARSSFQCMCTFFISYAYMLLIKVTSVNYINNLLTIVSKLLLNTSIARDQNLDG